VGVTELIEPLADRADQFLRDYMTGAVEIVVPDLFWLEISNVLWKATCRGKLTYALAQRALEVMINRDFPTLPSRAVLGMRSRSLSILDEASTTARTSP
jgi:predicted nucleic acid-binding protein